MDLHKGKDEQIDRFLWQWLRIVHKFNRIERQPFDFGLDELIYKAEVHTIDAIYDHKNINVTDLAKIMGVTKGAVSQILRKIQKKGFVKKIPHPENARECMLKLTPKGLDVVKKHDQYHKKICPDLIQELESMTVADFIKINRFF